MPFQQIRDAYETEREAERDALSSHLAGHPEIIKRKLEVITHWKAGKGDQGYIAGGKIAPYDLRNCKWVELKGTGKAKGFNCVISLNMPIIAPSTETPVALYDRIGLFIQSEVGTFYYKTEIYTDIDLPLDEEDKEKDEKDRENKDKEKIVQLVLEQYDIYCQKKKET